MIALTGTEKQIKWAEEIRAKFCSEAEALLQKMNERSEIDIATGKVSREKVEITLARMESGIALVNQQTEAKYWIENVKDLNAVSAIRLAEAFETEKIASK